MGRLWQVGIGVALAATCWIGADAMATKRYICLGRAADCFVTEQTPFGTTLIFVGWFLIVVAAVNLMRFFSGK